MATKANSKSCKTFQMEHYPQIVNGFRGELRILPNIYDGVFSRNSQRSIFLEKLPSWLFDKVLNMLLNWLPKLRMFHF